MPDVEVVGQDDPFSNVIDFRTRETYEPPEPTPRERIVAKKPDEQAISMMESMIDDFREGIHHGLVMVVGDFDEKGNLQNYRFLISETACAYPVSFTGAIEQMKLDLADMAVGLIGEGDHPENSDDELYLISDDD